MSREARTDGSGRPRGAVFARFAALTGLDAALRETARLTDQRITLDEYEQAALDETLQTVRGCTDQKRASYRGSLLFCARHPQGRRCLLHRDRRGKEDGRV